MFYTMSFTKETNILYFSSLDDLKTKVMVLIDVFNQCFKQACTHEFIQ